MHTRYFDLIHKNLPIHREELLQQAARLLQRGCLVAIPTETTYGLAASIFNETALERLYATKQRGKEVPLPVQIANIEQLKFVTKETPCEFMRLAHCFLPGPLTIVLKKHDRVSKLITAQKRTVAVRFPSNKAAQRIVELVGCPIALSSANRSGNPSSVRARHVMEDFEGMIDGIVDDGDTTFGLESTLISLENPSKPLILRLGVISQRAIEKSLDREVTVHHRALMGQTAHLFSKQFPPVRLFSSWDKMRIYLLLSSQAKRLIMTQDAHIPDMDMCDLFRLTRNNLYVGLRIAMQHAYAEVLVLCTPNLKNHEMLYRRLKQIANS